MYTSTDERVFELQVFDGKEYAAVASGKLSDLEPSFASLTGKTRRLVLPGKHPARPKYCKPRHTGASGSKDATIGAYFEWARGAGLKQVHVYEHLVYSFASKAFECVPVPLADFLGPVVEDEPERMAA